MNVVASVGTFVYIRVKCQTRAIHQRLSFALSAASCFSVGLFLGICYLGLYHSAATKMLHVQNKLPHDRWLKAYPISETILCLGFFVLWILEWLIRALCDRLSSNVSPSRYTEYNPVKVLSMTAFRSHFTTGDPEDEVDLLGAHEGHTPSEFTPVQSTPITLETKSEKKMVGAFPGTDSILKSLMLTLAMGIHAFLEALGFGLLDTTNEVSKSMLTFSAS
ncbi:unnamed protein product [Echinostoma caproni]|uniref:Membrane magnesium transporter n=1 Tax=Echinostoma caproni TaxID=27848 RepID=A0A183B0X4_9TREM|nr:unnamed protein product [Echinostoma caproni]